MKIEIEIKEDRFNYSYTVGSSTHSDSSKICPESLAFFTDILRCYTKAFGDSVDRRIAQTRAESWIAENPLKARELTNRLIKE